MITGKHECDTLLSDTAMDGPDADEGLTECDICGEYDGEDNIVVVTDEEDGEDVTLCADCAEDWG